MCDDCECSYVSGWNIYITQIYNSKHNALFICNFKKGDLINNWQWRGQPCFALKNNNLLKFDCQLKTEEYHWQKKWCIRISLNFIMFLNEGDCIFRSISTFANKNLIFLSNINCLANIVSEMQFLKFSKWTSFRKL